jgi:formylglycine-generating enzyme required for sulfatase activity
MQVSRSKLRRNVHAANSAKDELEETRKRLEVRKLELEVIERERSPWKSKEAIGFQGSVLVGLLSLLATTFIGFCTTNEKIEDATKRQLVSEAVSDLNSSDIRQRTMAGRRLAVLDDRFNFREVKKAYDRSLAETEAASVDPKYQYRTPFLRVGTIESIALNSALWRQDPEELANFLRGGLKDPSMLVRHKAIIGLHAMGKLGLSGLRAAHDEDQQTSGSAIIVKRAYSGEVIHIPEGWAVIGRDDTEKVEGPATEMLVPGFWIDARPVSNRQWQDSMGNEVPAMESEALGDRKTGLTAARIAPGSQELPVVGVSIDQARRFCTTTGGRDLPSEIQWEVAARGRLGWSFPWGHDEKLAEDILKDEVKHKVLVERGEPSFPHVQAMSKPQPFDLSPFRVAGMVTSVRHWTKSEWADFQPISLGHQKDCAKKCVLKGAAGYEADNFNTLDRFRATRRMQVSIREGYVDDNIGFRCVSTDLP